MGILNELPIGMIPNIVGGLVVFPPFLSEEEGLSATGPDCLAARCFGAAGDRKSLGSEGRRVKSRLPGE